MEDEEKMEKASRTTNDEVLRARLMARRRIDAATGCWEYDGALTGNGYGYMRNGRNMAYTHRVSAVIFLGLDTESGWQVLHHCDNPPCFRPDHLYIGTRKDNARDAVLRGRMTGKKLTVDQVMKIKQHLADGRTHRQISAIFDVTAATIGQIARGETWKNVEPASSPNESIRGEQDA